MTEFLNPKNNIVERGYFHLSNKKDQIAFYFADQKMTYEEALKKIDSLSQQFATTSLKKGNTALVLLPLGNELVFVLLSLMRQGIIPILIDPRLSKKLWKSSILKSNPDIVISHPSLIKWHWLLPWTWRFQFLSVGKKTLGSKALKIDSFYTSSISDMKLPLMNPKDIIIKTLTSGTTGEPKIIDRNFETLEAQQRLSCKYLPHLEKDIHLSLYGIGILQSFIHGSSTIISSDHTAERIFNLIQKHQVSRISIPPGILYELIHYCKEKQNSLTTIKCVLTGGAPIPLWFRYKIKNFFPEADCFIVYGSTECEPISKVNLKNINEDSIVGYPVGKNIEEIQITKKFLCEIKGQRIYQISLEGPNCVTEDSNHVLEIGDLASFDDQGQIWLLGRSNEVYKGIPAAYIEELTERIDGVKRALFLRKNETNYLLIENLEATQVSPQQSEELKKIQQLTSDLGLGNLNVYLVKKLPTDPRHLWKIQRQYVSSLLKDFCRDKLNI